MNPIRLRIALAGPILSCCALLLLPLAGCGGGDESGELTPTAEKIEQEATSSMDYMMDQQQGGEFD